MTMSQEEQSPPGGGNPPACLLATSPEATSPTATAAGLTSHCANPPRENKDSDLLTAGRDECEEKESEYSKNKESPEPTSQLNNKNNKIGQTHGQQQSGQSQHNFSPFSIESLISRQTSVPMNNLLAGAAGFGHGGGPSSLQSALLAASTGFSPFVGAPAAAAAAALPFLYNSYILAAASAGGGGAGSSPRNHHVGATPGGAAGFFPQFLPPQSEQQFSYYAAVAAAGLPPPPPQQLYQHGMFSAGTHGRSASSPRSTSSPNKSGAEDGFVPSSPENLGEKNHDCTK